MKNLRTHVMLCVCISLFSLSVAAQKQTAPPVTEPNYNKPRLFENMPSAIPVTAEELNTLLTSTTGKNVTVSLTANKDFRFEGQVVSTASQYDNTLQSIVIRSSNFEGARFTLSKATNADGTVTYTGRILSFQHGDVYELKTEGKQMRLVKKDFYDLVNE